MRILILISSLDCGGAESHVVSLASELGRLGNSVAVASAGGRMEAELIKRGVETYRLPLNRKDPWGLFMSYTGLIRIIREHGFDILHAHTRPSALVASRAAKSCGITLVCTIHARFRSGWLYRRLSRWGSATIAVSEDLRHYLCTRFGVDGENTFVVANGIDTERFHIGDRNIRGGNVVFASRLDADCSEAAFLLCSLWERIKAEFPQATLTVCGGGDMLSSLSRVAGEREDIRLLGDVERIEDILQGADLFIGVSRAAMEAMSCGVPTVLGGNEGYFGVVRTKEDMDRAALGNFCCRGMDRLNEERLFLDICECLSMSKDERRGRGRLLSKYIEDSFGARQMAKLTEGVYRKALSARIASSKASVVLCGYYGYGNLGDNALLRAAIDRARKSFSHMGISAMTRDPKRDSAVFGVRCIKRSSPLSVMKELSGARVLVFGGGTLLQESTSLRSLIYYWAVIRYAWSRGIHIELWGNGIGPVESALGRILLNDALLRCDYLGLRDKRSLEICEEILGKGRRTVLESDLATGQGRASPTRIRYLRQYFKIDKDSAADGYAVVAVRGVSGRGYIDILSSHLMTLTEQGIRLLFLPMFPREDLAESKRLCSIHGGVVAEGLTESDAAGIIDGSRVVLGMRLHALVFAASAKVPFVGFGADPKIEVFCRENGGAYFTDLY